MGATYGGRALSKSTSEWQRCTLGVAMMITSGLDDVGVVESGAESADGDLDGLGERVGGFVPYLGWQVLGAEGGWGAYLSRAELCEAAYRREVLPVWPLVKH